MDETPRCCGLILNRLHGPCHLDVLHEGFHESYAGSHNGHLMFVAWWTPGASACERRYSFESMLDEARPAW